MWDEDLDPTKTRRVRGGIQLAREPSKANRQRRHNEKRKQEHEGKKYVEKRREERGPYVERTKAYLERPLSGLEVSPTPVSGVVGKPGYGPTAKKPSTEWTSSRTRQVMLNGNNKALPNDGCRKTHQHN